MAKKTTKTATATTEKAKGEVVFLTGFPGFITQFIIRKMAREFPERNFYCLVESRYLEKARQDVSRIDKDVEGASGRIQLIAGDITKHKLALNSEDYDKLVGEVNIVYHLAAIYDLAISADVAWRINVEGTRNILDFVQEMKNLKKLVYFSPCYVSRLRTGRILEEELDMGQTFKNHYESTKFHAEREVRNRTKRASRA